MSYYTFVSGVDTSLSTHLNKDFSPLVIKQIYTGTGFNVSASATTTSSTVLTLSAADINGANYAVIEVVCSGQANCTGTGAGIHAGLQIQTANIADSTYTDLLPITYFVADKIGTTGNISYEIYGATTFKLFKTLTAGEQANGLYIKLIGKVELDAGTASASISNIQTRVGTWF